MSYPALARLLIRDGVKLNNTHLKDAQELFRRMVFSILMVNTDDHEKNHTLLVMQPFENSQIKLAPAYDLLPTNSGQGFQEFICGVNGKDATLVNAMSECEAFGYSAAEASLEMKRVIDVVNTWQAHFEALGVSKSVLANLALRIDGDFLLSQRKALH